MSRGQRVTLKEIAAEVGVSMTTMSKVLNGAADVSSATRERVEEHLRARGYRRRRSRQRREYIEVVLHELDGEWALAVIEGVREAAADVGLAISLSVSGDRRTPGPEWVEAVLRRGPTGVILLASGLAPPARESLRAGGIPFVLIDPAGDPAPGVPAVGAANWAGGVEATRHLIDLGHRRIGIVSGPADAMAALARVDGHRSAMRAAGLPIDPELTRFGDVDIVSGEQQGHALLDLADPPTAVFATSDVQALGVMHAATARGLRVPDALSVVGFDDLGAAQLAHPLLTTVHQPVREIAQQATQLVLRLLDDAPPDVTRVELATRLVVRDSTASVPSST